MRSRPLSLLLLALAVGCASTGDAAPATTARGVLSFDAESPEGAVLWRRPTWNVGDRFELLRQDVMNGTFEVVARDDAGYRIDAGGGHVLLRDLDLGSVGSVTPDGQPLLTRVPADARYHWPLWIGKAWQCEFVDRLADGSELPTLARYVVEDLDTITVPAGTFEALRIVRRTQLVQGDRRSASQTHIVWYAPKEGVEVRQLIGNTLVELVAHERAR